MSNRPAFKLRTTRSRGKPEDCLQASVVQYHAHAVDQRLAILFAVPNGERRDPATAARLTGMTGVVREQLPDSVCLMPAGLGVLPGVSDLVLLLAGGRIVLIELKIPKEVEVLPLFAGTKPRVVRDAGTLSKVQKRFRTGAEQLGHVYRVVRTVEEYADLLEEFGVQLRCRPWGPGVKAPRPPVGFGS